MWSLRTIALTVLAALLASLLAMVPASAETDGANWTRPEILGAGAQQVLMDVNADGAAVAAWMDDRSVKASYRPAGKGWQRPVVLDNAGESGDHLVGAFVDDRGRATVGWWIYDGGDGWAVLADRSIGGAWTIEGAPSGGHCCMIGGLALAMDEDGTLVQRWWSGGVETGVYGHLAWRTSDRRWTKTIDTNYGYDPFVVHDASATFVRSGGAITVSTAAFGQRPESWEMVRDGTRFSTPALVRNRLGDLIVATVDDTSPDDGYTQAGQLLVMAKPRDGEWRALAVGPEDEPVRVPSVAVDDSGRVIVAYRRASDRALLVRTGTIADGLGEPVVIASPVRSAAVATSPRTGAVVVWHTEKGGPVYFSLQTLKGVWEEPVQIAPKAATLASVSAYPNGMFTALMLTRREALWSDLVDDHVGPRTVLVAPKLSRTATPSIPVRWVMTDALSRPDSADVRVRTKRRDGRLSPWSIWKHATVRTRVTYQGRPARTYCFAVRGRDRAGNVGQWSDRRCTTTPRR